MRDLAMTTIEYLLWYLSVAGLVTIVLGGAMMVITNDPNASFGFTAFTWILIGACLLGIGFLPAALLTGARQLLNSHRKGIGHESRG